MEYATIEHIDTLKQFVNHLLTHTWLIALIGICFVLISEKSKIYHFFTQSSTSRKDLYFLVPKLSYVATGVILTIFSRTIVTWMFSYISNGSTGSAEPTATGYRLIDLVQQYGAYASFFALIGCIIAGHLITLSAGDRRCISTAKTIYFITLLSLLLTQVTFLMT